MNMRRKIERFSQALPWSGRLKLLSVSFAGWMAFVLLVAAAGYAIDRASQRFLIKIDDVTSGGGQANGTQVVNKVCAIGQHAPIGFSASAGFRNQAGVIQALEGRTAAADWHRY